MTLGNKKEKNELELELVLELVKMFENQGAPEFGEGLKAKKTVKATKANMNP